MIKKNGADSSENLKKKKDAHSKGHALRSIFAFFSISILLAGAAFIAWPYIPFKITPPSVSVMENKIKDLREISTVRQTYRNVIYSKNRSGIFTSEILFAIDYNIIAGIDLSEGVTLKANDSGVIEVTLPPAKIFSIDADEKSIEELMTKGFRRVKQSDYMEHIVSQKAELAKAAIDSGILIRARANAEDLLEKLFRMAGYTEVRFKTADGGFNNNSELGDLSDTSDPRGKEAGK